MRVSVATGRVQPRILPVPFAIFSPSRVGLPRAPCNFLALPGPDNKAHPCLPIASRRPSTSVLPAFPSPPNLPIWIPQASSMAQERHPQILAAHVRPSVPVHARILGPSSARPRLSSSSSSTSERGERGWVAPMNVLMVGTILLRMQLNHQYRRSQCRISREYAWMTSRAKGFGAN